MQCDSIVRGWVHGRLIDCSIRDLYEFCRVTKLIVVLLEGVNKFSATPISSRRRNIKEKKIDNSSTAKHCRFLSYSQTGIMALPEPIDGIFNHH